jgi:hypothetical protein
MPRKKNIDRVREEHNKQNEALFQDSVLKLQTKFNVLINEIDGVLSVLSKKWKEEGDEVKKKELMSKIDSSLDERLRVEKIYEEALKELSDIKEKQEG